MGEMREMTCPRCGGSGKVELTDRVVFGMNVQRLRKAHDWTQQELAERLELSRVQVSNIETGRFGTSFDGFLLMARVFGCSTDDLLQVCTPDQETGS